jgi:Outer membrane protein beta-barrel domain
LEASSGARCDDDGKQNLKDLTGDFTVKNKLVLLLGFVLLLGMTAFAQEYPKFEVPVGFSFVNVHPNQAALTSFNVFGGGGGFVYNFSSIVGIKADFMGYTQGSGQKFSQNGELLGNVSGNLFTYMFGPQFKKHSGKFQPFGEALFGAAHTNLDANICKLEGGCSSGSGNNNGFAMEFGGGLDIPVAKNFQIRPVEVDYIATHFGANHVAGYSAWQNNFKYVAGVNFTFGGK